MKALDQLENLTENLLLLNEFIIESGLENTVDEYKTKITPKYLKDFIQLDSHICKQINDIEKWINLQRRNIDKINIQKKINIQNHKKQLNMLNHLIVLKNGDYYIPYMDHNNEMKYAEFRIVNNFGITFISCKSVYMKAGMFKNEDIVPTPFFKGAKDIRNFLNGKMYVTVEHIGAQLFYDLYNKQIKNYKK